jgi:hypothetical protein
MNIEKQAAARLLDKGIKVPAMAPLFLRVFGKRQVSFTVRQPFLGTLYRISLLYLEMNISDERLENMDAENVHVLFAQHGQTLAKIAAQAILNGHWSGKLLGGMLGRWLFWHLNSVHLLYIVKTLVSITGTDAFTNTIGLVRDMKMTTPSQTAQGS